MQFRFGITVYPDRPPDDLYPTPSYWFAKKPASNDEPSDDETSDDETSDDDEPSDDLPSSSTTLHLRNKVRLC